MRGGPRCRRRIRAGHWAVHGRVERFTEPALLLLLHERPTHGYELLEQIEALTGERADMGNLYRVLRALEQEGIVRSEWRADAPGPARRRYELTEAGQRLLDSWAIALRETQGVIAAFLDRYGEEVNDARA